LTSDYSDDKSSLTTGTSDHHSNYSGSYSTAGVPAIYDDGSHHNGSREPSVEVDPSVDEQSYPDFPFQTTLPIISAPPPSTYYSTTTIPSVSGPHYAPSEPGLYPSYPGSYPAHSNYGVPPAILVPHPPQERIVDSPKESRCYDHGCNGRAFSTHSNFLRHQREKSGQASKSNCPRCGAQFTRKTAMNGHLRHEKCKRRSGYSSSSDRSGGASARER
jgi:hypothetical protein